VIDMDFQSLIDAINYRGVVTGLTHDFYRYPARFSPLFARTAVELFTRPGDTVLDPFAGGFTSLVEALAAGRNAVGIDISELAVFLGRVKTAVLNEREVERLRTWAQDTAPALSPCLPVERHELWREAGYQVNLPWRFRKVAEQALNRTNSLPERVQRAARCVVLKTVQWAVDCKEQLPTAGGFRDRLWEHALAMADGYRALRKRILANGGKGQVEVFHATADDVAKLSSDLLRRCPPTLVVTSPPYPGVHVLYHRWQVRGRRETSAPFWIADCRDGQGAAFYTFGDRRKHDEGYFGRLQSTFAAIRQVVAAGCVVVQLVGFARPHEHLSRYLEAMRRAGFEEYDPVGEGRRPSEQEFWRSVPNRKWYNWLRPEINAASEVLLLHRAAGAAQ
jgi:DNA methylase